MTVGTLPRPADDDYPIEVKFHLVDVFIANAIVTATAIVTAVDPVGSSLTALHLGTPTVAANVVTFRVYGGVAGVKYTVAVTATNAAGPPPNVVCRSIEVPTETC